MKIEALLQRPNALPVAPKVVQELIASFSNDHVAIDEISHTISADPVLSAKLLRLANSAYFHVSRSVDSVDKAVVMLGFVTVRTLVISSGLVNGFKGTPGLDLKQFWRYCLLTSVAAKWLASQTEQNSDMAFTAGMTHAIGQLVMHTGMPEDAAKLDNSINPLSTARLAAERAVFGYGYSDVGAELAARWKFPESLCTTIRAVPHPLAGEPFNAMAGIVHLAAWAARAEARIAASGDALPVDVIGKLEFPADIMERMPPVAELANGLDELIS